MVDTSWKHTFQTIKWEVFIIYLHSASLETGSFTQFSSLKLSFFLSGNVIQVRLKRNRTKSFLRKLKFLDQKLFSEFLITRQDLSSSTRSHSRIASTMFCISISANTIFAINSRKVINV